MYKARTENGHTPQCSVAQGSQKGSLQRSHWQCGWKPGERSMVEVWDGSIFFFWKSTGTLSVQYYWEVIPKPTERFHLEWGAAGCLGIEPWKSVKAFRVDHCLTVLWTKMLASRTLNSSHVLAFLVHLLSSISLCLFLHPWLILPGSLWPFLSSLPSFSVSSHPVNLHSFLNWALPLLFLYPRFPAHHQVFKWQRVNI